MHYFLHRSFHVFLESLTLTRVLCSQQLELVLLGYKRLSLTIVMEGGKDFLPAILVHPSYELLFPLLIARSIPRDLAPESQADSILSVELNRQRPRTLASI